MGPEFKLTSVAHAAITALTMTLSSSSYHTKQYHTISYHLSEHRYHNRHHQNVLFQLNITLIVFHQIFSFCQIPQVNFSRLISHLCYFSAADSEGLCTPRTDNVTKFLCPIVFTSERWAPGSSRSGEASPRHGTNKHGNKTASHSVPYSLFHLLSFLFQIQGWLEGALKQTIH